MILQAAHSVPRDPKFFWREPWDPLHRGWYLDLPWSGNVCQENIGWENISQMTKTFFSLRIPQNRLKIIKFALNWCFLTNFWWVIEYFHWYSGNLMLQISSGLKKFWILLLLAFKKREKTNFLVCHLALRESSKVTKYWNSGFQNICQIKANANTQILSTFEGHVSKICPIYSSSNFLEQTKMDPF